jgi:hypothetical protein
MAETCPDCGFAYGTGDTPGQRCLGCERLALVRRKTLRMVPQIDSDWMKRQLAQRDEQIMLLRTEKERMRDHDDWHDVEMLRLEAENERLNGELATAKRDALLEAADRFDAVGARLQRTCGPPVLNAAVAKQLRHMAEKGGG